MRAHTKHKKQTGPSDNLLCGPVFFWQPYGESRRTTKRAVTLLGDSPFAVSV